MLSSYFPRQSFCKHWHLMSISNPWDLIRHFEMRRRLICCAWDHACIRLNPQSSLKFSRPCQIRTYDDISWHDEKRGKTDLYDVGVAGSMQWSILVVRWKGCMTCAQSLKSSGPSSDFAKKASKPALNYNKIRSKFRALKAEDLIFIGGCIHLGKRDAVYGSCDIDMMWWFTCFVLDEISCACRDQRLNVLRDPSTMIGCNASTTRAGNGGESPEIFLALISKRNLAWVQIWSVDVYASCHAFGMHDAHDTAFWFSWRTLSVLSAHKFARSVW